MPWWLQIYILRNRNITERMLDAAVEGGARAIVLTVDTPVVGRKEDDGRPVWELSQPGQFLANLPEGDWTDDDLDKADDLSPTHRLAGRAHRAPGGGEGRLARR